MYGIIYLDIRYEIFKKRRYKKKQDYNVIHFDTRYDIFLFLRMKQYYGVIRSDTRHDAFFFRVNKKKKKIYRGIINSKIYYQK